MEQAVLERKIIHGHGCLFRFGGTTGRSVCATNPAVGRWSRRVVAAASYEDGSLG